MSPVVGLVGWNSGGLVGRLVGWLVGCFAKRFLIDIHEPI